MPTVNQRLFVRYFTGVLIDGGAYTYTLCGISELQLCLFSP